MECPICNGRFSAQQIQSHVEQCLIDQDAAMALKVHREMNDRSGAQQSAPRRAEHSVPTAQPAYQARAFPPAPSGASGAPIPRYGAISVPTSTAHGNQPRIIPNLPPPSSAAPVQSSANSGRDSRVYGATKDDVDKYNSKIGVAHKQLAQIRDSLQSFSERISLIEMRKYERIVSPVEIASLPPPRYVVMKATQPTQSQLPLPNQPRSYQPSNSLAAIPPTQQDKRQRFFQSAQRFYNDKSGANSFFTGATNAGPATSAPVAPTLGYSGAPTTSAAAHHNVHRDSTQAPSTIPIPKPQPSPLAPLAPETGITDIHVAQIESKWISMVLQYPEDAEDLILGHLTMLFAQRVKERKVSKSAEISAESAQTSEPSLSNSSEHSNGDEAPGSPSSGNGMQHPLSEYVSQMIETWNEPFSRMREPSQETLQTVIQTVKGLISTLEDVVLDYYKELSARNVLPHASQQVRAAAEYREALVRQGVRNAIWPLFYEDVMKLIRLKTSAEDDVVNQKMKDFMTMNPAHLGIPRDYWLLDLSPEGSINAEGRTWSTPPYYTAIQTFKELSGLRNPESKLKCVVKSAKDLVSSVARFHAFFGRNPDKYPVGGEELLPIFTYVVIRSGVKNLNAECTFMELFATDEQVRGEMGYILATLQAVTMFLPVLDNNAISNSVESVFKAVAKEVELQRMEAEVNHHEAQQSLLAVPPPSPPAHNVEKPQLPSNEAGEEEMQEMGSPEQPSEAPYGEKSTFQSVDVPAIGLQEGSFFENDPSLDSFDGSESMLESKEAAPSSRVEIAEFNPRA